MSCPNSSSAHTCRSCAPVVTFHRNLACTPVAGTARRSSPRSSSLRCKSILPCTASSVTLTRPSSSPSGAASDACRPSSPPSSFPSYSVLFSSPLPGASLSLLLGVSSTFASHALPSPPPASAACARNTAHNFPSAPCAPSSARSPRVAMRASSAVILCLPIAAPVHLGSPSGSTAGAAMRSRRLVGLGAAFALSICACTSAGGLHPPLIRCGSLTHDCVHARPQSTKSSHPPRHSAVRRAPSIARGAPVPPLWYSPSFPGCHRPHSSVCVLAHHRPRTASHLGSSNCAIISSYPALSPSRSVSYLRAASAHVSHRPSTWVMSAQVCMPAAHSRGARSVILHALLTVSTCVSVGRSAPPPRRSAILTLHACSRALHSLRSSSCHIGGPSCASPSVTPCRAPLLVLTPDRIFASSHASPIMSSLMRSAAHVGSHSLKSSLPVHPHRTQVAFMCASTATLAGVFSSAASARSISSTSTAAAYW